MTSYKHDITTKLTDALWKIYQRPHRPTAWSNGGNLPWDDPNFSKRMLREHLEQSHGAATRVEAERQLQLDWFQSTLGLQAGMNVLDVTCGPGFYSVGLAQQGCNLTGIDFAPASIDFARNMAAEQQVDQRCHFIHGDVREVSFGENEYDAALFIYGQLAVFSKADAQALLSKVAAALKPGGKLCIELLNQDRVDKSDSKWWYTDDTGLWGDAPYLHLGERFWDAEAKLSMERFYVVHLETGELTDILLCDQTYSTDEMTAMLQAAGFASVNVHPNWAGLPLYDAQEWNIFIAEKAATN